MLEIVCGTIFHALPPVPSEAPPAPPPAPAKTQRDAWGQYPNLHITENFAFKWGNEHGVSQTQVEELAEWFELSWAVEVGEFGHTTPWGSQHYLFNVYIGDTGAGVPSTFGNSGYFTVDDQNYPMIVYGWYTMDNPDFGQIVAAHEFHHALQWAENRYGYEGVSAWYWEASGNWAPYAVFPNNAYYAISFPYYTFLPHYPLNFFDYPDEELFQEQYQYGASLFLHHLSEVWADRQLIVDSWQKGASPDPLVTLDELLEERGSSLEEAFIDHIGRNATWDYPNPEVYPWIFDYYAQYYPDEAANMVLGPVQDFGSWSPPEELIPGHYGYNVIQVDLEGLWEVQLVGLEEGEYHGVVSTDEGRVPFEDKATVEGPAQISVGAWGEPNTLYAYELVFSPFGGGDTGDTGDPVIRPVGAPPRLACSCSTPAGGAAPGLLLLVLGAVSRRRVR